MKRNKPHLLLKNARTLPRDFGLQARLEAYATVEKDFWSFRGDAVRDNTHGYFQYPAMMVPKMQAELLAAALEDDLSIKRVFDPFVGAGTSMTEAMKLGLDFEGQDINPLAVLLCKAKSIPHYGTALEQKVNHTIARARADRRRKYEAHFTNIDKWFRQPVIVSLSRIRRAIRDEKSLWARRFMWVAMAETVRLSSNSRTTTFKLHIRDEMDRVSRQIRTLDTFERICKRNLLHLRSQQNTLSGRGFLERGIYRGDVKVTLCDTSTEFPNSSDSGRCDLLLTSPPYGDNASTIPYGQHSYLPLQWIDLKDIDTEIDDTFLSTTHAIDSKSLGGHRTITENAISDMRSLSRAFGRTMTALRPYPRDRALRVAAFCRDLEISLDPVLARLRPGALMIWIVGNRNVAGMTIPLTQILLEFLCSREAVPICQIQRRIPSKRIAVRNSISKTMGRETVMVLRTAQ